jgi:hypothetical protein
MTYVAENAGPVEKAKDAVIAFRLARRTYADTVAIMKAEMAAVEAKAEKNRLPIID